MIENLKIRKEGTVVVVTGRSYKLSRNKGRQYASDGFRCTFERKGDEISITETGRFEADAQAVRDLVSAQRQQLFQ